MNFFHKVDTHVLKCLVTNFYDLSPLSLNHEANITTKNFELQVMRLTLKRLVKKRNKCVGVVLVFIEK